jgi:glycosyltransferase involved in cell wall biosynthesis
LPESYLLYHGPSHPGTLLSLLESWTWAAASIGELYPLVMLGLTEEAKGFVEGRLPDFHLEDYVHILPRVHPAHIAAIYQSAAGLAHPAPPSLWGGPMRLALACGLPLAAQLHPATEAMVGDAAYLVEAGDLRGFGAAMITIVVHDQVRGDLQQAAKKISARWEASAYQSELLKLYQELA